MRPSPEMHAGAPRFSIFEHPPLTKNGPRTWTMHDKALGIISLTTTDYSEVVRACHEASNPADVLAPLPVEATQMELGGI